MRFLVIKNFLAEATPSTVTAKIVNKLKKPVVKKDNWAEYSPEERTKNLSKPSF